MSSPTFKPRVEMRTTENLRAFPSRGLLLLLLSVTAILLPGAVSADVARLGNDVVPTFQAIDLVLDADADDYRGAVRVELEVKRATDVVRFHSEGPELTRVALMQDGAEIAASHQAESDEVVRLETETPLAPGAYQLEVEFTNVYDTQAISLYRMEKDGQGYLFTQFQADDAREAFPCWDEPAFKNPFQMTLTVPEAHLAVTNTPIEESKVEDGWRTIRFRKTKPLPSYLLAIATGPLETVAMPGLGVPARVVTVRGQGHLAGLAIEMTAPLLKALEAYFGSPYPYAKLDFLAVPEFWPGGMENAGAITYADRLLLLDPEAASVSPQRSMARVIAHELAHMWFGDMVTMEWWDDLWLNESFATWMGDKVVAEVFPQFGSAVAAVQSTQGILQQDARATTGAIRKPLNSPKDLLSDVGLAYQKGRTVLGMFEQWMGPETFRRGVIDYIEANAWGNAEASDLWRALDAAAGKNVSGAMATFLDQPGFPRIDVELRDDGKVELRQTRFRNHGSESEDLTWQIPVSLKVPKVDGGSTTHTVLLDAPTTVVELGGKPAWIFPNADGDGYYRWRLPSDQLLTLADQAGDVLSARERVELIGNVSALLLAGSLHGDEYLEVLGALADDPDPLVVRSLLGALGAVKTAFVPAELEAPFAAYLRRTLGPAIERFGLERAPGEAEAVSLVRPNLYTWLGREGRDQAVLEAARTLASRYMEDASAVDPSLAGTALRLAAVGGDRELFDDYTRRLEAAATPSDRQRYLNALGAFDRVELRRAALAYALEGPLRPNEIFSPGQTMGSDAAGRDLLYRWMTESYDQIMTRVPPIFAGFMPFVASGCSAERLAHAEDFFAQPEHQAPGTARQLAKVAEQVRDCVALREREGEAVARFLKRDAE